MRIQRVSLLGILTALALCLVLSVPAFAANNAGQTHIGRPIHIAAGEQTGDVTCIACSIYIRGQVTGDATAVGGSILIEDQGGVDGDATTVGGSLRVGDGVKVGGDATVVGGDLRRGQGSQIGGDVTNVGGSAWVPVVLLIPFLFLGLLIALVVWLVHRARRPSLPAAA